MLLDYTPAVGDEQVLFRTDESYFTWGLADRYRSWGWSVLPLFQKLTLPTPNGLRRRWKHHQGGPVPLGRLLAEWQYHPTVDGVGVVAGTRSGVGVIDFDRADAYERWAAVNAQLAARCPTVRTSKGYHVYFRPVEDVHTKIRMRFDDKWLNVGEVIADPKHYFVAAGSRHPSGVAYEWVGREPDGPADFPVLAFADLWVHAPGTGGRRRPKASCVAQSDAPKPVVPATGKRGLALPVDFAVRLCAPEREGERNDKLCELARRAAADPATDPDDYFTAWWALAAGVVRTDDYEFNRKEFGRLLAAVHTPHGAAFLARCEALTADPPSAVGRWTDTPTRKLAALLSRWDGDEDPYLSLRALVAACGFSAPANAGRRLKEMIAAGLVVCTVPPTGDRAGRYRWVGDKPENQQCALLFRQYVSIRAESPLADGPVVGFTALAAKLGCSESAARKWVKGAVARGEIVVEDGPPGRGRPPKVFRLVVEEPKPTATTYGVPVEDAKSSPVAVSAGPPCPRSRFDIPARPVPVSAGKLSPRAAYFARLREGAA